jgi:hypothetical protein
MRSSACCHPSPIGPIRPCDSVFLWPGWLHCCCSLRCAQSAPPGACNCFRRAARSPRPARSRSPPLQAIFLKRVSYSAPRLRPAQARPRAPAQGAEGRLTARRFIERRRCGGSSSSSSGGRRGCPPTASTATTARSGRRRGARAVRARQPQRAGRRAVQPVQ